MHPQEWDILALRLASEDGYPLSQQTTTLNGSTCNYQGEEYQSTNEHPLCRIVAPQYVISVDKKVDGVDGVSLLKQLLEQDQFESTRSIAKNQVKWTGGHNIEELLTTFEFRETLYATHVLWSMILLKRAGLVNSSISTHFCSSEHVQAMTFSDKVDTVACFKFATEGYDMFLLFDPHAKLHNWQGPGFVITASSSLLNLYLDSIFLDKSIASLDDYGTIVYILQHEDSNRAVSWEEILQAELGIKLSCTLIRSPTLPTTADLPILYGENKDMEEANGDTQSFRFPSENKGKSIERSTEHSKPIQKPERSPTSSDSFDVLLLSGCPVKIAVPSDLNEEQVPVDSEYELQKQRRRGDLIQQFLQQSNINDDNWQAELMSQLEMEESLTDFGWPTSFNGINTAKSGHLTTPVLPHSPVPSIFGSSNELYSRSLASGPTFECGICCEKEELRHTVFIEGCDHCFCQVCLQLYVKTKIEDHRYPIFCPGCLAELTQPNRISKLTENDINKLDIPPGSLRKLKELERLSQFVPIECPRCSEAMNIDKGSFAKQAILICHNVTCGHRWCKTCTKTLDNPDRKHRCKNGNIDKLMRRKGWKYCPGCSTPVQKEFGCNHITCGAPGCNVHFCYRCGSLMIDTKDGGDVGMAVTEHYYNCRMFEKRLKCSIQ